MTWMIKYVFNGIWRHQIISQTADNLWPAAVAVMFLPNTKNPYKWITLESFVQNMREKVLVANQSCL